MSGSDATRSPTFQLAGRVVSDRHDLTAELVAHDETDPHVAGRLQVGTADAARFDAEDEIGGARRGIGMFDDVERLLLVEYRCSHCALSIPLCRGPLGPCQILTTAPPLTSRTVPVMNDDSSEARNSAAFAMSSALP